MKLATYQDGSRDGQLVIVSRNLQHAAYATHIAHTLQQVLDDWQFLAPQLQDVSVDLNAGRARQAFAFNPVQCMAPLPRAHRLMRAPAYAWPIAGHKLPQTTSTWPADRLYAAHETMACPPDKLKADFESGWLAVTDDIAPHATPAQALGRVRLLGLAHSVVLVSESAQVQPWATYTSPVWATPDELGDNWRDGRIQASLHTTWNGRKIGMCDCGQHMPKHAGQWLSMASQPSGLGAGSVWLSGPVANEGHTTEQQLHQWPKGYHHIAHKRAMEQAQTGHMQTQFLQANDTLHIDMKGRDGQSLFGAIAHQLHDAQNHAAWGD